MTTTAEGTYTDNGDDTITIDTPEHVHHDMFTDTILALDERSCEHECPWKHRGWFL